MGLAFLGAIFLRRDVLALFVICGVIDKELPVGGHRAHALPHDDKTKDEPMKKLVIIIGLALAAGGYTASAVYADTIFNQASTDSWIDTGNWNNGVPSGTIDVVINSGTAQVDTAGISPYIGSLTLNAGTTLDMEFNDDDALNALGSGLITLNTGSVLATRRGATVTISNDIHFAGDASILNLSNPTDNDQRFVNGVISGSGQFTYGMRRGNLLALGGTSPNTHSGGMIFNFTDNNFGNTSRVRADKNGAFGLGDVWINDGIYLELLNAGITDAIADSATLFLDDRGEHASPLEKVTLAAGVNETIGGLVYIDYTGGSGMAVALPSGIYGRDFNNPIFRASDGGDRPLFDGAGSITVVPEPNSLALLVVFGGLLVVFRHRLTIK
jgi:hypothetical protein